MVGYYLLLFLRQNSPGILGRETLLREITRNFKFLGNFGTVYPNFGGTDFLGNLIDAKSKFGIGTLGLYSKILRKFWGGSILLLILEARIEYERIEICRINDLMLCDSI